MLPAGNRLRHSREFATTIRSGRRAGADGLVVHLLAPSTTGAAPDRPGVPRVGFVVSRAVGGAVVRNRVRRRLRHVAASRLPGLPPGAELVIRALPTAAAASSAQLAAVLDDVLARAAAPLRSQGRATKPAPSSLASS